jgi:hypothetical protein
MTHTTRFATTLLTAALAAQPAAAQSVNLNTRFDEAGTPGCNAIDVTSDEFTVQQSEETFAHAPGQVSVRAPQSGGVWITGSDAGAFEIRACKFALGNDRADADTRLQQIRVTSADRITAEGPDQGRWLVYFIVSVPRGSSVDAQTTNGPITIRDMNGDVTGRAVNGPISVTSSRGTIDVETVNGPIDVTRSSGDVRVRAQNGPISVKLEGTEWEGQGLRGGTQNGPLTVTVPDGYTSGVVVEADGRSPFRCVQCSGAQRSWDDDSRRVQLGSGPERVHLKTVNGPVTVKR